MLPFVPNEAPAFREPWQARAFALVVLLHREGCFAWDEWVRTLGAEIAGSPQRAGEDAEQAYHRQFLAALEKIVAVQGMATRAAMQARKDAWRRAYLNTPHGHPVELAAGEGDDPHEAHDHVEHHHEHEHGLMPRRQPVAVSPARR